MRASLRAAPFVVASLACIGALGSTADALAAPAGGPPSLWPAPLADDAAPVPAVDEPELARRPAEIIGSAGALLFDCLPLVALCEPREAGPRFSVGALWRASPSFAWGGTLSLAKPSDLGVGTTIIAALTGRTYFADHGAVDPYLELSLGAGRYARRTGAGETLDGQGMMVEAGGGVDFHLSERLRFGPALRYGQFVFGRAQSCSDGACRDDGLASVSPERGFATLVVGVTVLAGNKL
jgi:hypothetical protein